MHVLSSVELLLIAVQNAAIFWYNYDRFGSIDQSTLHAGCPVLLGEKWGELFWILKQYTH